MILLAGAFAGETSSWDAIWESRLADALDGTPEAAASIAEEGLGNASETDPLRGELLYALGRFRADLGDARGARGALGAAVGARAGPAARALAERLELAETAVDRVPTTCGFERDRCGFLRAWETAEKGTLEVREVGEASVLAWDTTVVENETDRLLVAFAPDLSPRSLTFRVRADRFPADLRLTIGDGSGWRWAAPVVAVSSTEWATVTVPLVQFRPLEADSPLSPRMVRLLEIEDLSGLLLADRGANTVWFDDLEIR